MEVPGPDSDWRSPQFRQKVVAQIEEAMRKAGTAHTKSSTDMENHVYVKAKTREEYLFLVASLIVHFRDILGGPGQMPMQQIVQAQQQQPQPMQFQPFQQVQQQQFQVQQQLRMQQQQHHQNQQLQQQHQNQQQQAQNQQQQNPMHQTRIQQQQMAQLQFQQQQAQAQEFPPPETQ